MPKVSSEYIEKKREGIVDAAFRVCQRKTVCTVTMQDVIDESGLSQGGIYRFYSNIDEILADVLDKIRREASIDDEVDEIVSSHKDIVSSVKRIFRLMSDTMKKDIYPYYKIEFEYNILIANYPERARRIYTKAKSSFLYQHFLDVLIPRILEAINAGQLKPRVSLKELFQFNSSVYDGILKRAIALNNYEAYVKGNKDFCFDIDEQFRMMYLSTCYFLGIEPVMDD